MNILAWIIVGLLASWLAQKVVFIAAVGAVVALLSWNALMRRRRGT